MRAQLNGALQAATSVEAIKAHGDAFEAEYGASVWGCVSKGSETFGELYNQHLAREQERAEDRERDATRAAGIMAEIETCRHVDDFQNIIWFVNRIPALSDSSLVGDAMEVKGKELGHPDYLEEE